MKLRNKNTHLENNKREYQKAKSKINKRKKVINIEELNININTLKNKKLNHFLIILIYIIIIISQLICQNEESNISFITIKVAQNEHHVYSDSYTSIKPSEIIIEGIKQNEVKSKYLFNKT